MPDKKVKIGNILFDRIPLILAPMEDVTDPPFRVLCREKGADWVFSEFISADGLIRDAAKSLVKLDIYPGERPVSIQIFGAHIEAMVEAARMVEQVQPDFIDLNFGCPVRKVAAKGAGAGMLQNIPKMVEMTRQVVNAVKVPVTVKTRLGWDENTKNITDTAERLQDVGIAALAIHGRTRSQFYTGVADWTLIGEVKNNPRMVIPIIGNGDIKDPASALNAITYYGVDGLMIGRAAIGNPWIFQHIRHYLETGETMQHPSVAERALLCKRHLEMSVQWKGERTAVLEMRKHYCTYFRGLQNFKPFRMQLVSVYKAEEVYDIIERIMKTDFEVSA
jgi:nifR3 family TIM-barrel protein